MTFALIATHAHLLRLPRVLQVSQASDFLKERLLRQCHVRTLPTVEISGSSRRQTEHPIDDVTIVDCAESACAALKALVKLSDEGRYIAWNVHQHDAASASDSISDKDRRSKQVILSAFAGEDVDFGNGPHLFVRTRDERYVDQFKRYFELNDSQCVWHDMSSSFNTLSTIGIRPNGFHRDVQTMAYITALVNDNKKLKLTKTSTPIDLQSLASSVLYSSSSSSSSPAPPSSKQQNDLEWVEQVCDETMLLHSVHDRLCQVMENTPLSNLSTPLEYQADITCVLDAYDNFFRLVQQSLYDIETTGVDVDPATLKQFEKQLREQNTSLEKVFLEWASKHCEDAKHMSASNATQLRQLLFAPCFNSVNGKQSLARTGKFTVSVRESDLERQEKEQAMDAQPDTSRKKKKAKKGKKASTVKEIELTGMGLAPQMYLKNGWPSTSTVALKKLVGHPSIVEDEDEEEQIKHALNHLIQASESKSKANKISKVASSLSGVHGRLPLRHYCGTEGIGVFQSIDMPTKDGGAKIDLKYGPDLRRAITSSEGNKFVIVRYHRLRLWALAQLSQCSVLRERVEHRHDMATTGALRLYKGLLSELQAANPDNAPISDEFLKAQFPETYSLARRVDSAFKVGGGVGGTARISVVTGQRGAKARELRVRWYGAHPMVEQWHHSWRDDALTNGVVSSMMGRPHPVTLPQNASRIKVETALTNAMQFVLAASAAEGVMAGVTRMTMNEQLRALGWSVVVADDDTVVLEGPDYSVDSALPLIAQNTSRPFALKSWVTMNVAPVIASSLQAEEVHSES